jgi:hypothetical protein
MGQFLVVSLRDNGALIRTFPTHDEEKVAEAPLQHLLSTSDEGWRLEAGRTTFHCCRHRESYPQSDP